MNSKGGSGLGMSISYKIIEMHGWKLQLHNKREGNMGKAFYIVISK